MAKLKVAHFAAFCPGLTGQYATVKDMIKAERTVGIDAQFIATSVDAKKIAKCSEKKEDGWLKTKEAGWARSADIMIRHSCIPDEYINLGIPVMMSFHGRPESTFIIEFVGLMKIYKLLTEARNDPRYRGYITFWKEHEFFHKQKVDPDKLYYVPAMVDLDEYNPEGKKVGFNKASGNPNIIVADMWRHDMTPYACLYATSLFRQKYCSEAKVHIFGLPEKKCDALIGVMRRNGTIGSSMGLAKPMSNVYRGGDLLVTPHNIATRVVRESLACGLPIVGGSANPFTDFKADPRDIEAYSEQIHKCWEYIKDDPKRAKLEARAMAESEFNVKKAGEALLSAFESVLKKESARWKPKGKIFQRHYESYRNYQLHQKSKVGSGMTPGEVYQKRYRKALGVRIKELIAYDRIRSGQSVLCLGARDGTEVQAWLDNGFFAVGIDILSLSPNFVLKGDFQKIPFPDDSLDIIFMNCIDHTYDIDVLLKEVKRVLKLQGSFITEFGPATSTWRDKWASCRWRNINDIKNYIAERGFSGEAVLDFVDGYFVKNICFHNLGVTNRINIINGLIEKYKYKKYLEIGSQKGMTFRRIKCKKKVSVDPYFKSHFKMTSDDYFEQCNGEMFDIIFIDGEHVAQQVFKDIENGLKHLNPKGRIVLHDCNPKREFLQYSLEQKAEDDELWCGDGWKAFARIRMTRDDVNAYVVNCDYGIGILSKEGQLVWEENIPIEEMSWDYLQDNREELLKLKEPEEYMI